MTTMTWFPSTGSALALVRPNYFVPGFSGFGGAPTSNRVLRAPYQDGGTLVDTRLDPREMTLSVYAPTANAQAMWDRRQEMATALNPKLGIGTLRVATPTGRAYEINAMADGAPIFAPPNTANLVIAQVSLLAPHPYWYDADEEEASRASFGSIAVTNEGHVPSWLEVEFEGPLTNPRVALVGSNPFTFVRVLRTLVTGETIILRAGPGAPTATRIFDSEESDAAQFLSTASDLAGLRIPVGASSVEFTADAGSGSMTIRYKHWFEGI